MRWSLWLLLLFAASARAEDARFGFMAKELAGAADPRSRALAALMLGATQDPDAEPPLCQALGDPSELVRAAAARALGQVHHPKAGECLAAHAQDPSASVRDEVGQAEKALALQARRPPFLYVAFADPGGDPLLRLAEDSARRRLTVMGARFAPAGESTDQARAREAGSKLPGVRLSFAIERHGKAVRLTLRCARYPEGAELGKEVLGAGHADPEALVRGLAARAVDLAAADLHWRH